MPRTMSACYVGATRCPVRPGLPSPSHQRSSPRPRVVLSPVSSAPPCPPWAPPSGREQVPLSTGVTLSPSAPLPNCPLPLRKPSPGPQLTALHPPSPTGVSGSRLLSFQSFLSLSGLLHLLFHFWEPLSSFSLRLLLHFEAPGQGSCPPRSSALQTKVDLPRTRRAPWNCPSEPATLVASKPHENLLICEPGRGTWWELDRLSRGEGAGQQGDPGGGLRLPTETSPKTGRRQP